MTDASRISVSIRIRPKLGDGASIAQCGERYEKVACCSLSDTQLQVLDARASGEARGNVFTYDHIFDADATQDDVYEGMAVDAVEAVLEGANATVMAYGQTGSGKTFTVLGEVAISPLSEAVVSSNSGILMRAIQDILWYASKVQHTRHVVVGISVLELYLDEVRDLLHPTSSQGAPVTLSMTKDILRLPNLTYAPLTSIGDALAVYRKASARRIQRATAANDTSSRSHAIFSIDVFQYLPTEHGGAALTLKECVALREQWQLASADPSRVSRPVHCEAFAGAANALIGSSRSPLLHSKLTIVDLAGSEKTKHADVYAEGFEELRRINASLTALGNVVHNLHEGSRHIPYRDSKLTMVLRDTFASPSSRIALLVNVSPTALATTETLSSLYFADKVKMMKVDTVKPVGSDAKLEEAYLSTLQIHDALLADLHIAAHSRGDPRPFLAYGARLTPLIHPLFIPNLHIVVPDTPAKTRAMHTLCERLKETAAQESARSNDTVDATSNECAQEVRRQLDQYHTQLANVKRQLSHMHELQKTVQDEVERQKVTLNKMEAAYQKALADSHALANRKGAAVTANEQMLTILKTTEEELRLLVDGDSAYDAEEEDTLSELKSWDVASSVGVKQLQLALDTSTLRSQWVELMLANRSLERANLPLSSARSAKCPLTVEQWLKRAVVVMARNAVTQSTRNAQRRMGDCRDGDELCVVDNFHAIGQPSKYWIIHQHPHSRGGAADGKHTRRRRSAYDDPLLLDSVFSFLDMGCVMQRVTRDGSTKRRMFYIARTVKHVRWCWDEPGQSASLTGDGAVDLHHFTGLLIGQGTPYFTKLNDPSTADRSFSVFYRLKDGPEKHVDVVCASVREMETWVIGLTQLSQVPLRSTPLPPSDLESAGPLSTTEKRLCCEWCIPPSVLLETKTQVDLRRRKNDRHILRLTPGQLASLTGLDVFRGSALWLYFRSLGHIEHGGSKLYCYVSIPWLEEGPSSSLLAIEARKDMNTTVKT